MSGWPNGKVIRSLPCVLCGTQTGQNPQLSDSGTRERVMKPSLSLKSLHGVLVPLPPSLARESLSLQLSAHIEGMGVTSSGAQQIRDKALSSHV